MRENLMSGSMWQGMETRTSKSQAPSLDPTSERWGFMPRIIGDTMPSWNRLQKTLALIPVQVIQYMNDSLT